MLINRMVEEMEEEVDRDLNRQLSPGKRRRGTTTMILKMIPIFPRNLDNQNVRYSHSVLDLLIVT